MSSKFTDKDPPKRHVFPVKENHPELSVQDKYFDDDESEDSQISHADLVKMIVLCKWMLEDKTACAAMMMLTADPTLTRRDLAKKLDCDSKTAVFKGLMRGVKKFPGLRRLAGFDKKSSKSQTKKDVPTPVKVLPERAKP